MKNFLEKLKRKINYFLISKGIEKSRLYIWLVKWNKKLFHRADVEKMHSFGEKNPDTIFYLIQVRDNAGMLATIFHILHNMEWAEEMGYVPIVDMVTKQMRDEDKSFFLYYQQKTKYSLEEIYQSKKVILSGGALHEERVKRFKAVEDEIAYYHQFFCEHICFTKSIQEKIEKEKNYIGKNSLGVFLRGTDYTSMKPAYHPIQPDVSEVINKIKEFERNHKVDLIYLVTEDCDIYRKMIAEFPGQIYCTGTHFVEKYDGKCYIEKYIKNLYEQNLEYLTRINTLASCRWLIASRTNGSNMARILNNNNYEECFFFDKGVY